MGTLLASIGVSLLLNALTGNDDFMLIDIVQRDLYPFMGSYGTWDGMGRGKKKGQELLLGKKQSIQLIPVLGQNKPFSNFDMSNFVKHFGIKYFRGIFAVIIYQMQ